LEIKEQKHKRTLNGKQTIPLNYTIIHKDCLNAISKIKVKRKKKNTRDAYKLMERGMFSMAHITCHQPYITFTQNELAFTANENWKSE